MGNSLNDLCFLEFLDLSHNRITRISDDISPLSHLSTLFLNHNSLEFFNLLEPLKQLPKLKKLSLNGHDFSMEASDLKKDVCQMIKGLKVFNGEELFIGKAKPKVGMKAANE